MLALIAPLLLLPTFFLLGINVQLDVDSWQYFGRAMLVAMLVSTVEELVYRGPLFWGIKKISGKAWLSAVLTGALFFLVHVRKYSWNIDAYAWFVFCSAVAISVLRCQSMGFYKGLIFHWCMNSVAYFCMGLAQPPFPVIRKHVIGLEFTQFYACAGTLALLATFFLIVNKKQKNPPR